MTIDVSHIKFSSTAFPTAEDLKLWHSLSEAEKRAIILNDVRQGLDGPVAKNFGKDELVAQVLAEYADAL